MTPIRPPACHAPRRLPRLPRLLRLAAAASALLLPLAAAAQDGGFDKIEDTVANVEAVLVAVSVAVVTISIIWAGFKMIFQGARLVDVANVLIGGTLVGGAAAFATYIVN
jgi:type IV secretion system protein VirB2